ncbi:MAG TPA: hypothetical protein DD706_13760 [Nitrospiraceae bacterium]|nr:hypothetical protein [Nitrospiraceae bacterium]
MCGRYTLRKSEIELTARKTMIRSKIKPRFNIAPSQQVPVFRVSSKGQLEDLTMQWGLIPAWAKETKSSYSMINAREETVRTKPAYRGPFKKRRCLIPTDGWFEWQKHDKSPKQPYFFHLSDDEPFFFAGLWDHWEGKAKEESIDSCTIITTNANLIAEPIHHRMPVILSSKDYDAWLDPTYENTTQLEQLLIPYSSNNLTCYAVSLVVNNARYDGPNCIVPLE